MFLVAYTLASMYGWWDIDGVYKKERAIEFKKRTLEEV